LIRICAGAAYFVLSGLFAQELWGYLPHVETSPVLRELSSISRKMEREFWRGMPKEAKTSLIEFVSMFRRKFREFHVQSETPCAEANP